MKPSSLVSNLRDDPNKRQIKHHILKFSHQAVKYNCMRITDIISSGDIYYFKCTHFHQNCDGDVLIEASSKGFQIYHLCVQDKKQKRLNKQLTLRKVSDRGRPEDLKKWLTKCKDKNNYFKIWKNIQFHVLYNETWHTYFDVLILLTNTLLTWVLFLYIQVYFLKPNITYKQLRVNTITYFATCFPLYFYFVAQNFTIIFFLSNVEICHCNKNKIAYYPINNEMLNKILSLSIDVSQEH